MEWYLPMTILPGVALIITTTSHMLMSLNAEITMLEEASNKRVDIISAKLVQLKLLSLALVFQFLSILFFLFSGIIMAVRVEFKIFTEFLLVAGIFAFTVSIIVLLIYSLRAVSIRQKHLMLSENQS